MPELGKDYFLSKMDDKLIVARNPNAKLTKFEDLMDVSKRYLYEVGQKIVTPFGVQTIKEIVKDYGEQHGYEWLITVEENGNQYKPVELIGIYVSTISDSAINPVLYAVEWIEIDFGSRPEGYKVFDSLDTCIKQSKKDSEKGAYASGGYFGPVRPISYISTQDPIEGPFPKFVEGLKTKSEPIYIN
jgi:hypothetical protein